MKKIIFIICVFLFSVGAIAQSKSNLTINTTGTSNLKITFNGQNYSLQDRSATFQSLTPGSYPLIIYQWQVKNGSGQYEKVYDGTVNLTAGKHVEMLVMRFGKTAWDEAAIAADDWNEFYTNPKNENDDWNYNGTDRMVAVNDYQFGLIKKALNDQYNEDERLNWVKVVFKNNLFTVAQIREIFKNFYNETKGLVFVKYAYDYCIEKNIYFSLADVFYSSDRKKDFIKFLSDK